MDSIGQSANNKSVKKADEVSNFDQIVLEKVIFSNVFEKDIRRVYIYRKSERIAKAIHLVSPAFKDVKPLRDRIHRLSIDIVDASILPPGAAKDVLARELLALSSVFAMAKSAGIISSMNADIIMREAHHLLQEIAGYEEPRVALDDTPTLAALAKAAPQGEGKKEPSLTRASVSVSVKPPIRQVFNGHSNGKKDKNGRRESIIGILKAKGPVDIKDLSTLIREVSEKTIQRELQALIQEGQVLRSGERRWTRYALTDTAPAEAAPSS